MMLPAPKKERIAKVVARSGVCSRREAEQYIIQRRISVNGVILTSPAVTVFETDVIFVDGEALPKKETARMWRYHKPKGELCTRRDPKGRPTIFEALEKLYPDVPRLVSVGRLDWNSEGLLLLTNSGSLARHLELPTTGWIRRYKVRVLGTPFEKNISALKKGITVEGVRYGPIQLTVEKKQREQVNCWVQMSLKEGKNQEIRKVMKHLGHVVSRLIRLSYGPFQLGSLEEGHLEEIPTKALQEQLGTKWVNF